MSNKKNYMGRWRITEMSTWDKDYFDMEVSAYIKIEENLMGDFQFGLVSGQIDGKIVKRHDEEYFEFSWEGNDECDPASGIGWLNLRGENDAEGEIKIHLGDSSTLHVRRMKNE